jgi:hypothetical protein
LGAQRDAMLIEKFRISIHRHYYRICIAQRKTYENLDAQLATLMHEAVSEDEVESNLEKQQECYELREQAAVIVITFAGMCLEAFFYDYAATHLGDTYAKEHLDKLDLKSKLLIVPRLVCGKEVDKSAHVYQKVQQLVTDRNYLIHFKSKGFEVSEMHEASEFHDEMNERFRNAMTNGIEAIELVMKELDKLHSRPDYYFDRVRT